MPHWATGLGLGWQNGKKEEGETSEKSFGKDDKKIQDVLSVPHGSIQLKSDSQPTSDPSMSTEHKHFLWCNPKQNCTLLNLLALVNSEECNYV